jgi:dephospho-CoA kinase
VVHCLPEQQLERLRERDQLDEASAVERIAAQWPLEQKQQLADQLIDNSSDTEKWKKQIKQALKLPHCT